MGADVLEASTTLDQIISGRGLGAGVGPETGLVMGQVERSAPELGGAGGTATDDAWGRPRPTVRTPNTDLMPLLPNQRPAVPRSSHPTTPLVRSTQGPPGPDWFPVSCPVLSDLPLTACPCLPDADHPHHQQPLGPSQQDAGSPRAGALPFGCLSFLASLAFCSSSRHWGPPVSPPSLLAVLCLFSPPRHLHLTVCCPGQHFRGRNHVFQTLPFDGELGCR